MKDKTKIHELNRIMDFALAGAIAGLLELDSLITQYLVDRASNVKLDTLYEKLERRARLQHTIEMLSRPVSTKKDGTLYYTGGNR